MRILSLELLWNLISCLVTKNLFSCNPAILIDQRKPAFSYIQSAFIVSFSSSQDVRENTYARSTSHSITGNKWKPSSHKKPLGKKCRLGMHVKSVLGPSNCPKSFSLFAFASSQKFSSTSGYSVLSTSEVPWK